MLTPMRLPQLKQSYFELLPFAPAEIGCLPLSEMLVEKIRVCYQRNKAPDIFDLARYATRPFDPPLIRRLVVLKLWQARDRFDPARLTEKFEHGVEFDWDDLADLVGRDARIDRESSSASAEVCVYRSWLRRPEMYAICRSEPRPVLSTDLR